MTRATIADEFDSSVSNVSRHLSALVAAGWIARRTTGRGIKPTLVFEFLLNHKLPPARVRQLAESQEDEYDFTPDT